MNATDRNGRLRRISDKCFLQIGTFTLFFNNLPELGESKSANYESTTIIGRATPIVNYSHSENRTISCSVILLVQEKPDCKRNIAILRNIQSAVYPRKGAGAPYFPPTVCRFQCGSLFSETPICCVMKDYNVKFPTDVPWDEETLCPYRMEVSMTLEQVFASQSLPNQDLILQDIPFGVTYGADCNGVSPQCFYPRLAA
jgi:hypothetical protein